MSDPKEESREEGEVDSLEPDFSKKHPLENRWTLWFDNPNQKQTQKQYGQSLRSVYTFDTVEDFWCLYNNIRTPSQVNVGATYYLFKEGIEPKWEDAKNLKGGCWTAPVPGKGDSKKLLDAWWLNSVLACIGEQFTDGDEINGIAVVIRTRGDRIELWTRTASNEAAQTMVGKQLKQFLDISDSQKIGFSVFEEKIASGKAKDRYMV
ncbi:eukaryotic translation initiation factor 4E [Volvox carteri f. nagariensis]|uniref:eIF-4F 25 kDa subunit n=1 Tax=Volvox carteri f. nagariensis TaxID=3068 RepID=D8UI94_VOLCA|nr:eukaryotic translation initiation factor 4E [Volvox carteri f. nagariensis]EFJ40525.1 eukaryotic translation initiation factor 4E [Volvox carteri f. nagariensis]|eukprot:XP_002958375.1 eukaryotic translation initiation factor 4E [Volvox carteri f. nagariensis]